MPTQTNDRALAEQAYIYGYPMLENYKTMYIQAIDEENPSFQAPLNVFYHISQPVPPDFPVVTPNNDTLYSLAWLDLSRGPVILEVPLVVGRYYSFQLVDMYTFNFAYVGTRATAGRAGCFLIAGPSWNGTAPDGVEELPRSEGNFVCLLGRTEFKGGDADLAVVNAIQSQYILTPPVGYSPPPKSDFPTYDSEVANSPRFVDYLNFLFSNVEINERERSMIESWSAIGVIIAPDQVPGTPEPLEVQSGVDAALAAITAGMGDLGTRDDETKWDRTLHCFGNREEMLGVYDYEPSRYLVRASAAMFGLYGNTEYEAYYPKTTIDINEDPLDSLTHDYTLHFSEDIVNPIEDGGFWSITIYKDATFGFVPNERNVYSLGNRSDLLRDPVTGAFTFYLQKQPKLYTNPEGMIVIHPNWLPAPGCPGDPATAATGNYKFYLVARLYVPTAVTITAPGYSPPAVVPTTASETDAV